MRLNEKGQCPVCLIKSIPYKRFRHYFCHRCDRAYSMDTGEQIDNWAWRGGERTKLGGVSHGLSGF